MKDLEGERRTTLRDFLLSANIAIGDNWKKLCTLSGPASDAAKAVDASGSAVDQEVHSLAAVRMEEKVFLSSCTCISMIGLIAYQFFSCFWKVLWLVVVVSGV